MINLQWLTKRRKQIEEDLPTIHQRRYLSPVFYAQYASAVPALRRYLHGKVIDLGCGTTPFWEIIADQVEVYHGLDRWPRSDKITFVGDLQNMGMLPEASYDGALCMEVLEHLPDPFQAVAEIFRILKPGAPLVLTVPHLSRLHDIPHDYYRYTQYGLRYLLEHNGFVIGELEAKGGLFCFLGHQLSTILLSSTWLVPAIRPFVWQINKWLVTLPCYKADQWLGTSTLFAVGYLAVAIKPAGNETGTSNG
jgi:SAM-dependent methyltransferase